MGKKSAKRALEDAAVAPSSDAPAMDVDAVVDTPKAKKSKKDKSSSKDEDAAVTEVAIESLVPIAKPLAVKKTGKHVLKLVKKVAAELDGGANQDASASPARSHPLHETTASKTRHLKRGVKEVVKSIRKGEKGIVVLAADISPVDILTHIPLLAEESNCPYIWVTSKESLGLASSTKRPTSCVMVAKNGMKRKLKEGEKEKDGAKESEKDFQESYEEVSKEVSELEDRIPTY
ncbi:snoRNA-binding protein [Microbotryomycetes sp. JL201]|nr:snoRNA-binding protein [Microbotryomycetes sp. JL201]